MSEKHHICQNNTTYKRITSHTSQLMYISEQHHKILKNKTNTTC